MLPQDLWAYPEHRLLGAVRVDHRVEQQLDADVAQRRSTKDRHHRPGDAGAAHGGLEILDVRLFPGQEGVGQLVVGVGHNLHQLRAVFLKSWLNLISMQTVF